MNFREERKHYFESFLARSALHLLVAMLGLSSAHLALIGAGWFTISCFLATTVVLEGSFLYDSLRGWPITRSPEKRPECREGIDSRLS